VAGTIVRFPEICPSSRSFKPGTLPRTRFEAQNGNVSFVQFGVIFTNAELTVQFKNITNDLTVSILEHYESVTGDDWVSFGSYPDEGILAIDDELYRFIDKGSRGRLRWQYAESPTVTSVYPGISTVSCKFIGSLQVEAV